MATTTPVNYKGNVGMPRMGSPIVDPGTGIGTETWVNFFCQLWLRVINGVAVGDIKAVAGAAVPQGWALCDGSAVSRVSFSDLFSVLGTTWGAGDGSTTFNLPDLRGKVLIGANGAFPLASLNQVAVTVGAQINVTAINYVIKT